jgi:hypothetical protein
MRRNAAYLVQCGPGPGDEIRLERGGLDQEMLDAEFAL